MTITIMYFYLTAFVTIVCLVYHYITRTFNLWKIKNVKGPKPIPFFGNFKDVFFRRKHVGVLYSELYKQYPNEKVVGLYRMTAPTLLIRDLDIVKQVLIKDFESLPDRGVYYSKERLGDNLVHADVDVMKVLRKHLSSVFTASKFRNSFSILTDRADKFVDYLENITMKGKELDTLKAFRKYGVDSIMTTLFGIYMDPYNDNNDLFDVMDTAIQSPNYFLEMELVFPGTLSKLNLSLFPERVYQFCRHILQAGINLEPLPKADRNNVMEVLMGLRQDGNVGSIKKSDCEKEICLKITDDVLTAQVFAFYFAGYGNNSLLTTYAMYELAKNPDVQEILYKKINEVLQKHDGKFTYEALNEMKYLQMVFQEATRLHPLTNSITRNVCRDIQLDGTDIVINKDTMVAISPHAIQHDEKYYPEPEKFKPERFLPENARERHPCALLTLGQGPRRCLGSRFAELQFGICVVKVLSYFRVEATKNTVESIKYTPMRLLLTPSERICLRLVPRNI